MAERTNIEWCDATWSPWEGCTKVSVGPHGGCLNCYAEGMNLWLRKGENWGTGAPRRVYGSDHWEKPRQWNAKAEREGRRLRVFPSVCDPFDNEVADILRARFADLIRRTPSIDWLLLTKRIGNAARMLAAMFPDGVPPNVRIGSTMVTQEEWDRDIGKLLALGLPNFVSLEPLMSAIDMGLCNCDRGSRPGPGDVGGVMCSRCNGTGGRMVDWVIAGGESGRLARPSHPEWFRSLRDQCAAAAVPFLFKQWGEWREPAEGETFDTTMGRAQRTPAFILTKTGTVHCFENEATADGAVAVLRVRKKAAGRLLDGVEHNEFPSHPAGGSP